MRPTADWMERNGQNAHINNALFIVAKYIKLDEEKWRSHFVCVITNETRFHSIPNIQVCNIRMSDIAHSLHASLFRFRHRVMCWCCRGCYCCCCLHLCCCCCDAFNFVHRTWTLSHSVWITNASHLNTLCGSLSGCGRSALDGKQEKSATHKHTTAQIKIAMIVELQLYTQTDLL